MSSPNNHQKLLSYSSYSRHHNQDQDQQNVVTVTKLSGFQEPPEPEIKVRSRWLVVTAIFGSG
ncbi:MAG: hypothetical protein RIM23_28990 [Coleofasciculus sp. G3-WIS-01]|uniref:hypothetical protein n=1 Tax=Coleofasciculus sp. G3-WIS-01 TaxID=3069528 RepID=UPI0032F50107